MTEAMLERARVGAAEMGLQVGYDPRRGSPRLPPRVWPPAAAAPNHDAASGGFSVADELMKLNQLCDQGILTEEQFAAQREKHLAG